MRVAERLYRIALKACPASFREDFGEDSAEDFARLVSDTEHRQGRLGVVRLCCRGLIDVAGTAIRERRAVARRRTTMRALGPNLRDARRNLAANPLFTLLVVVTLGLGIGANSAIFDVVYRVLLEPLPFADPGELVTLVETDRERGSEGNDVTPANFVDWRALNTSFEDLAAMVTTSMNLTGGGEPERLSVLRASSSLFPLLGVEAQLGRTFVPDEDRDGGERVALLAHGFWERRFGARPDALGADLILDEEPYRVVGVLPRWFRFPSDETELFVPLAMDAEERSARRSHYLDVIGRLRDGVSLRKASAEMDAIGKQLEQQYPETNADNGIGMGPLGDDLVGDRRTPLLVLLTAVGAVLLIAVVNVASLLLARSTGRRREVAVRAALGASPSRILGQLLTESAVLSAGGTFVGVVASLWARELLQILTPAHVVLDTAWLSPATVLFSLVLCAAVTVGMGLLPAVHLSRFGRGSPLSLRGSGSSSVAGSRDVLVVAEVTLAVVLLVVGGLMVRSFSKLTATDPGFRPENVVTMRIELSGARYREHHRKVAFYRELERRGSRLPGVVSTGFVSMLPLVFQGGSTVFEIRDREAASDEEPLAVFRSVTAGYFRTLGIPLLEGRGFDSRDARDAPAVAVVSEKLAREYFPDESAVGRQLVIWGNPTEIVGVVGNVQQFVFGDSPPPTIYVSVEQRSYGFFDPRDFAVRTSGDPLALASSLRSEIREIDPDQPIASVRTMQQIVSSSVADRRLQTLLLSGFAAVALVLATLGIYGVLSYTVAQRTDEIGLRMALGARGLDVVRNVAGRGMALALGGMALGLVGAAASTRVLSGMLYGVEAGDGWTWTAVATLLCLVALSACLVPAARAARIDPAVALRNEH